MNSVDRLCYRCSAPVAAGVPFCPQCNAPQIRVVSESEHREQAEDSGVTIAPPVSNLDTTAQPIRWSAAIARTAVAAVASMALLQLITVFTRSAALAFLALPLGGWFSVYLYGRRHLGPITAGMGARLGAVTGFFVCLITFAISAVGFITDRQAIVEMAQKQFKDAAAQNPSPQMDAMIKQVSTPEGMTAIFIVAAALFFFASLTLCCVGGALGGATQKRGQQ